LTLFAGGRKVQGEGTSRALRRTEQEEAMTTTLDRLKEPVATEPGGADRMDGVSAAPTGNLRMADWLYRSKAAGLLWLVARLWLGYEWLNAGYQKLWGSEKAGFWTGGGAGVKGFATAGVAGSATGKGGASYGWWAGFLHNFVIPNASWIAKLVTVSELAIGVLLILGLFTGAAAFAGIGLNIVYMFSGSAGVNPAFALVSIFLVLAWRNAGYFGLDRYALPMVRGRFHRGLAIQHRAPRVPKVTVPIG
jgi:thiosulfate dehydrogenase [quinone] large subunit